MYTSFACCCPCKLLSSFHLKSCPVASSQYTLKHCDLLTGLFTTMFNGLYSHLSPSDAELAAQTLTEESSYRFPSFSTNDAVTLGLSIRKRFRGSSRHAMKGRGLVITIQTIAGHTLFSCAVGDLGAASSLGDVSLDSWACLEGMVNVVRRTGHSSFYVEKGIGAMGKTPKEMGIRNDYMVNGGGKDYISPLFHIFIISNPSVSHMAAGNASQLRLGRFQLTRSRTLSVVP